jgi:hypothetical protein
MFYFYSALEQGGWVARAGWASAKAEGGYYHLEELL